MYAKTIVHAPEKVVHAYNAFIKEYRGGNGHSFWDPLNQDDEQDYQQGILSHDIFLTPVPADYRINSNHLSINGAYPASLNPSPEAQAATQWPGYSIWVNKWQFRGGYPVITEQHDSGVSAQFNTICFQEHQLQFQYKGPGRGDFSKIIIDKGHWGTRVYPGCGAVRRGAQMYLQEPTYSLTKSVTLTA
jgi:hypothetical protein